MFFVFNFLVFAYFTHSEINCFTLETIRATNYVREHEEISNFRGVVQLKGVNHKTNKLNVDLKSNAYDKILNDEMLSVEHRHNIKDSSDIPLSLSSKHHKPTLEIKQKWPMFRYANNVNDDVRKNLNKNSDTKTILLEKLTKNDDDYLELLPKSEITPELKLKVNKPKVPIDVSQPDKVSGLTLEIHKSPKNVPLNNKVIEMRSLPDTGAKEKCTCRKTNGSGSCNKCAGSKNNRKRCTHAAPNMKAHECSRFGATNHSCSQGQPFQSQPVFVTSNPYSFYPVYLPYSYFASEPAIIPYKVSYPQPNPLGDSKIPRKRKHKCHKLTTRPEDDLYYDDDSRERRPYDDSEYYQDSKKGSTTNIVYDINQDALIKEIVKDLKIHNNKDFVRECYCDSALSSCRVNMLVFILTLSCFAL